MPVIVSNILVWFGQFIMNPKTLFIGAGLLTILALGIQTHRVHNLKSQLKIERAAQIDPITFRKWSDEAKERQRDLSTCRNSNSALTASLASQTAQVEAWKKEADQKSAAAQAVINVLRKDLTTEKKVAALLKAQPSAPSDLCASAFVLVKKGVE